MSGTKIKAHLILCKPEPEPSYSFLIRVIRGSVAKPLQCIRGLPWIHKLVSHHEQALGSSCGQGYAVEAWDFYRANLPLCIHTVCPSVSAPKSLSNYMGHSMSRAASLHPSLGGFSEDLEWWTDQLCIIVY